MKLTGKCKEDFLKWYSKNIHYVGLCDIECHLDQTINAIIIEFFDSVGYRIGIDPHYDMQGTYRVCVHTFGLQSMDRNVATNTAIEKANELYNKSL